LFTAAVAVETHPLASVTVTLYVPAATALIEDPVCAGVVFQLLVYGPVPPEIATEADPFGLPHEAAVEFVERAIAKGSETLTDPVAVHPAPSVTVTEYVPAASELAVAPVAALLQAYEYGAVPELATAVADPVVPPKQLTGVEESATAGFGVPAIVMLAVEGQPFASVTVIEYEPVGSAVAFAVA